MDETPAGLLEIRALLYELIAGALYREPSAGTMETLYRRLTALLPSCSDKALEASIRDLIETIPGADIESLAVDYAGLFLSGRDGAICPSESSYVEHMIYGQSTLTVIESYREAGFIKDEAFPEPDDHIALECAFMSLMAGNLADMPANDSVLEQQLTFLSRHLLKWVPLWAEEVKAKAETPFYPALARLTRTLIEADRQFLLKVLNGIPVHHTIEVK